MAKKFSTPKLKSYPLETGKNWYVWFRYKSGNPIRISEGLNKITDYPPYNKMYKNILI